MQVLIRYLANQRCDDIINMLQVWLELVGLFLYLFIFPWGGLFLLFLLHALPVLFREKPLRTSEVYDSN